MRFLLAVIIFFALISCSREEEKTWNIVYEVNMLDMEKSTFRAEYTGRGDRDISFSPIEGNVWQSDTVYDIPEGKTVHFKVERISGNGAAELIIYRGKAVHEREVLDKGQREQILSSVI